MSMRGRLSERIVSVVHPSNCLGYSSLLAVGIIWAAAHWHSVWQSAPAGLWFDAQNNVVKALVCLAAYLVALVISLIVVGRITGRIHYALDPQYATQRAQRRRVKSLKPGDRLRVVDRARPEITVTSVDPSGRSFQTEWDDGQINRQNYSNVDDFEVVDKATEAEIVRLYAAASAAHAERDRKMSEALLARGIDPTGPQGCAERIRAIVSAPPPPPTA